MSIEEKFSQNEEEYGTGKIQKYLYDIMADIDDFCVKNHINYSLSGGSLLGAVRHQGFIPWDDDIDIMFDRKNYDRFVACAADLPESLTMRQSIWVKRITRKDNPYIDQEMGCIDLFVFDNVPAGKFASKAKVLKL